MNIKRKLYKELLDFAKNTISLDDYFVCVYGSYVTGCFGKDSDLDILIATKSYSKENFKEIRNFVVSLHKRNNLKIDEEVPYENKLVVLYKDFKSAINLDAFKNNGVKAQYVIPPIKTDPVFLKSKEVRLRLILNALTSPHFFIYGNKLKYELFKKEFEKAIVKLGYKLTRKEKPTADDIKKALFTGEHGECGQAHLGYKEQRSGVVVHLRKLIKKYFV